MTATFEEFTSGLLSAWSEDLTGEETATPMAAAARAAYLATVVYAEARGTILVACDDPGAARQTVQYLSSFFTDQERLRPLLKSQKGDTFELSGNKRIVVSTGDARRPGDLLECIALRGSAPPLKVIIRRFSDAPLPEPIEKNGVKVSFVYAKDSEMEEAK